MNSYGKWAVKDSMSAPETLSALSVLVLGGGLKQIHIIAVLRRRSAAR